jgi:hypothetical protein
MVRELSATVWDPAKTWHLAQINVGRARGTMDSPVMAGFAAQLEAINQLAESTPGFVWRLKDEAGDATSFRIFEDPMMMVNASVWESIEALRDFVYRSSHSQVMRGRAEWFEKPGEAYMALWWVPAGHIPTLEELRDRLAHRRAHGDTQFAFSFARPFPAPDALVKSAGAETAGALPIENWSTPECGWQE